MWPVADILVSTDRIFPTLQKVLLDSAALSVWQGLSQEGLGETADTMSITAWCPPLVIATGQLAEPLSMVCPLPYYAPPTLLTSL